MTGRAPEALCESGPVTESTAGSGARSARGEQPENVREIEPGIVTDFRDRMTYGGYLHLDELLSAQHRSARRSTTTSCCSSSSTRPRSCGSSWCCTSCARCAAARRRRPAAGAQVHRAGQAHPAHADRAVVGAGHADPDASTPSSAASSARRRASSRTSTARSSSCSATRTRRMLRGLRRRPAAHASCCRARSRRRASTTSSCATWPARGYDVPVELLERDVTLAYTFNADLVPVFAQIYENAGRALGRLRGLRGARRPRGQLPALAVPPPQDRGAHHRLQARHRRLQRRRLPAQGARAHVLPRAVRGPHRDRSARPLTRRPARPAPRPLDAADPLRRVPRPVRRPGRLRRRRLPRRQLARPAAARRPRELLADFVREQWGGRLIRGWDEGWLRAGR